MPSRHPTEAAKIQLAAPGEERALIVAPSNKGEEDEAVPDRAAGPGAGGGAPAGGGRRGGGRREEEEAQQQGGEEPRRGVHGKRAQEARGCREEDGREVR